MQRIVVNVKEVVDQSKCGLTSIRASDYAYYTAGNANYKTVAQNTATAPVNSLQAPTVLASNYATLRSTDNIYWVLSGVIAWAASQVKINYNNKTYLIGTNGNDNFDAGYYARYTQYFNSNLLVNFLAGGGDDSIFLGDGFGKAANDREWAIAA